MKHVCRVALATACLMAMTWPVPAHAQKVLSPDDFELTGVELISEIVSVRGEFQADAPVAGNVPATLRDGPASVRLELARTPEATLRWLAANGCRTRCSGLTVRGQVVVSPVTGRAALAVHSASRPAPRAPAASAPAAVASPPAAAAAPASPPVIASAGDAASASAPASAPARSEPAQPTAGAALSKTGAGVSGRGPAYDISRLDMGWLGLCGKCLSPRITGAWGLGSARAEAEGRITPEMAYGHCVNWRSEESCEDQRPDRVDANAEEFTQIHRASADCSRGVITTVWGETYTQAGHWPAGSMGDGRTRWRDSNGEIVGADHASNGLAISQNWEVLCLQ